MSYTSRTITTLADAKSHLAAARTDLAAAENANVNYHAAFWWGVVAGWERAERETAQELRRRVFLECGNAQGDGAGRMSDDAAGTYSELEARPPAPQSTTAATATVTRCAHCKHVYRNPDYDEDCDCPTELMFAEDHEEAYEVVEVALGSTAETVPGA